MFKCLVLVGAYGELHLTVVKRIIVDPSKCTGCRYCEMWCSFTHENVFGSSFSRITVVKDDKLGLDYPVVCFFCDPAPCIDACPTGALRKNEHGVTVVDEDLCTSCGSCIAACPYGAVKKHPIKNKPIICDLCGGEPVCVAKCPTNALSLHPIEKVDMGRVDEVFDRAYAHALKQYKKLMELWGLDIK